MPRVKAHALLLPLRRSFFRSHSPRSPPPVRWRSPTSSRLHKRRRAARRRRPSRRRSRRSTTCPIPYETVRNWGTLPDGRKWGSVSADPRRSGRQAHLGRRSLRRQLVRGLEGRPDRQARSDRQGRARASAPGRSCGRTAWTSTSRATSGSWTRASATAARAEEVPGRGKARATPSPSSARRQGAADARHAGRGRQSAGSIHRAQRCA